MEKEVLPIQEIKMEDMHKDELISLCDSQKRALEVAANTQEKLRSQLNEQVEMYNRDIKYLTTLNKNTVEYARAKEDALRKIYEGALELMGLDRRPIAPSIEGEEK